MEPSEQYAIVGKLGNQTRRKFGDVYLVEDKLTGEKGVLKAVGKENVAILERLRHEASFNFEFPGLPVKP